MANLCWLPIQCNNVMSKKVWIVFIGCIILGFALRFWQLGLVPSSPDWDEAALGYNAYSLLHTGRDEYGNFLPVVLRSFNDYKPALYAYLSIPPVAIFGLNVFAVRFASSFLGIATVIATFFLVKELFKRNDIALIVAFLLAISPWHIQFSRVAFETNAGLFCNVFGALFFIKGFKNPFLFVLSLIFFALSLYAYQSEKIFTPLLLASFIVIYKKNLFLVKKRYIFLSIIICIIVLTPFIFYTLTNKDVFARAKGVSIFSESQIIDQSAKALDQDGKNKDVVGMLIDNRRFVFARTIIGNYISHFSPNWLFITGDIERHHAPGMGLLFLWEFPFVIIGMYRLFFENLDKKTKMVIFSWFFFAPVAASVTSGVPHAVRTFNFLPMFQIFTTFGIIAVFKKIETLDKKLVNVFFLLFCSVLIFNLVYYLDQYFVQQNYYYQKSWQYGYKDAVAHVGELEGNYKKIIVSNTGNMDQSYIFFLFYKQYSPALYQQSEAENHSFGKFIFRPFDWKKNPPESNVLYVGNPDDVSSLLNAKFRYTIVDSVGDKLIEIVGT